MKTLTLCVAAALLCTFQSVAQTVSGAVVDTASNPIEGVVVVALTGDARQTGITATDKNGRFGVKTKDCRAGWCSRISPTRNTRARPPRKMSVKSC